jgi:hypothetical protein
MTKLSRLALSLLLVLALASCGPGGGSTVQPGAADPPGGSAPASVPPASGGYGY